MISKPVTAIVALLALFAARLLAQSTITTQPSDQVAMPGGTVAFRVAAAGAGPFTYQWQFQGTNLPASLITTVAGGGTLNPDGVPATSASFGELSAITIDQDDNLYVVAYNSARVYKVDAKNGVCRKVAGSSSGMSGDGGPATLAKLSYPEGVAVDREGNLYVADTWNCRVRKISADTGVITTVAGHGSLGLGCGYWGDGGPATLAMLHRPHDIAVDAAGNLYISDPGKSRVRMVAAGTGVITKGCRNPRQYSSPSWMNSAGVASEHQRT